VRLSIDYSERWTQLWFLLLIKLCFRASLVTVGTMIKSLLLCSLLVGLTLATSCNPGKGFNTFNPDWYERERERTHELLFRWIVQQKK
jgi:hypothetical protein